MRISVSFFVFKYHTIHPPQKILELKSADKEKNKTKQKITVASRRANQRIKIILLVKDGRPQVERGIKKIKMEALLAGKQALRHTPYHCVFGNMTFFFFSRLIAKAARGRRRGRRQNCVGVEGVWMSFA